MYRVRHVCAVVGAPSVYKLLLRVRAVAGLRRETRTRARAHFCASVEIIDV